MSGTTRILLGAIAGVSAMIVMGSAEARGQAERYELGRRLRDFESEWDRFATVEAHRRASIPLRDAVGRFFTFDFGGAGRGLDLARQALKSSEPIPGSRQWAESLALTLDRRLIEAEADSLGGTLRAFYPTSVERPKHASLRVAWAGRDGPVRERPIGDLPQPVAIPLGGLPEGDWTLRSEVLVDGQVLAWAEQVVSKVDRLSARLKIARRTLDGWSEAVTDRTTDRASARSLVDLLEIFASGKTLETDYPLARLLGEAEALIEAVGAGRSFHGPSRPGQSWITLVTASKKQVPARVLVPEAVRTGRSVPLVMALHGAGGSENLFFDGYGHGAIVALCERRGWLLAAPRSTLGAPPLTEVVDELARLYPVDRARVVLVGHSMGAAQAVAAAYRDPDRWAAVVALGGGGAIGTPNPGLDRLPFYVGIGTEDFALRGARSLAQALRRAAVREVRLVEFPDIEHLAIVQAALPDAFGFLDTMIPPAPR